MKTNINTFGIIALLAFGIVQFAYGGGIIDSRVGGPSRPNTGASGGSGPALPDTDTSIGDYDNQKTLTISGLSNRTGRVTCYLIDNEENDYVAVDFIGRTIANNTITFPLMDFKTNAATPWTGSGSYSIELAFDWDGSTFFYTDGKTWAQLGIAGSDDRSKLPEFTFSSKASTIDFGKFRDQMEWYN